MRLKLAENVQKSLKIKLNLPQELRHGVYANYMIVQHTPYEFQVHFAYIMPSQEGSDAIEADVVAKVNIPTELMPGMIRALEENFQKFRENVKKTEKETEKTNE
jgi:hypothetical protein